MKNKIANDEKSALVKISNHCETRIKKRAALKPNEIKREEIFSEKVINSLKQFKENSEFINEQTKRLINNAFIYGLTCDLKLYDENKLIAGGQSWTIHGKKNIILLQECIDATVAIADKIVYFPDNKIYLPRRAEWRFCYKWEQMIKNCRDLRDFITDIFEVSLFFMKHKNGQKICPYDAAEFIRLWKYIDNIRWQISVAITEKEERHIESIISKLKTLKIPKTTFKSPENLRSPVCYNISIKGEQQSNYTIDFLHSSVDRLAYKHNDGTQESPRNTIKYIWVKDIVAMSAT
jgi:hypothetical protein